VVVGLTTGCAVYTGPPLTTAQIHSFISPNFDVYVLPQTAELTNIQNTQKPFFVYKYRNYKKHPITETPLIPSKYTFYE
jgi:hypothetical protein